MHGELGCREQLANIFGRTFPNDKILNVASLAHHLSSWRLGSTQDGKKGSRRSGSDSTEFGVNLGFHIPSLSPDDLEDISDDDEDNWEELATSVINDSSHLGGTPDMSTSISTTPLLLETADAHGYSNSKESWQVAAVDGVGGITLRWLWNACEQGGHFSGSDLATAVCRVLESEKSGDEVCILNWTSYRLTFKLVIKMSDGSSKCQTLCALNTSINRNVRRGLTVH